MKQKPGGGGGGVEARDFTVSEGHGQPLVIRIDRFSVGHKGITLDSPMNLKISILQQHMHEFVSYIC